MGEVQGSSTVTLLSSQIPIHNHAIISQVVAPGGAAEHAATPPSGSSIGPSNPDGLYNTSPTINAAFSPSHYRRNRGFAAARQYAALSDTSLLHRASGRLPIAKLRLRFGRHFGIDARQSQVTIAATLPKNSDMTTTEPSSRRSACVTGGTCRQRLRVAARNGGLTSHSCAGSTRRPAGKNSRSLRIGVMPKNLLSWTANSAFSATITGPTIQQPPGAFWKTTVCRRAGSMSTASPIRFWSWISRFSRNGGGAASARP